jgi:ABC-type polysaccharide/polyol phosphate export permease
LAAPGLVLTDVRYALPLLQSLLFLTAPIAYPAPESGLLAQLNRANPLTALAAAPLAPGAPPAAAWTVLALLAAAAAALALAARFHAGALRRVAPLL